MFEYENITQTGKQLMKNLSNELLGSQKSTCEEKMIIRLDSCSEKDTVV